MVVSNESVEKQRASRDWPQRGDKKFSPSEDTPMKKQLFLTLVAALGFPLIMTLVPVCEAEQLENPDGEPVESTTGSITGEGWTGISGD